MTAIAVGSVRSGGATTVAMTLAAVLEDAVLVEADADGGVLALRYGLSREPGLVSLAASRQPPGDVVVDHAQRLPGGMAVVVGPESPERATQLLRSAGPRITALLSEPCPVNLVVDLGRLSPSGPGTALAAAAPLALVVARPYAEELIAAAERLASLGDERRPGPRRVGPVLRQRRDRPARVPRHRHRRPRPSRGAGPGRGRLVPRSGPFRSRPIGSHPGRQPPPIE